MSIDTSKDVIVWAFAWMATGSVIVAVGLLIYSTKQALKNYDCIATGKLSK